MKIAQKKFCVFAVWTPKGIKTETIFFDEQFWEEQMFPKLQTFFYDCILPEIVDQGIQEDQLEIRNQLFMLNKSKKKLK